MTAEKEEELQKFRKEEEAKLENIVTETRDNFLAGLAGNRQQHAQIKASVLEKKQDIRKQMKNIRVVMQNLFEQAEQLRTDREEAVEYDSDA